MIYTIGHEMTYLKLFDDSSGAVFKTGKRAPSKQFPDGYEGGYAFHSATDAQRLIDEKYPTSGYAIFGLIADWTTGVEQAPDGWWHLLLENAEIVRI